MLNDLGQNPKVAVITLISGLAKLVFHPFMTPYFRKSMELFGDPLSLSTLYLPWPINFLPPSAYYLASFLGLSTSFFHHPINFLPSLGLSTSFLSLAYQHPSSPLPTNFLLPSAYQLSFFLAYQLTTSLSLSTFFLPLAY